MPSPSDTPTSETSSTTKSAPAARPPDHEKRLRRQIAKLKELRVADAVQIRQLEADIEALVGALHLSQLENSRLRTQPANPDIRLLSNRVPDSEG
jgi:hypothetical protein